jgi:hypothetical protein
MRKPSLLALTLLLTPACDAEKPAAPAKSEAPTKAEAPEAPAESEKAEAPVKAETPEPVAQPEAGGNYLEIIANHEPRKPSDPAVMRITGIEIKNANFDPKKLEGASAEFVLDFNSLTSDKPKRDEHLKSDDFLDAPQFPTATVLVSEVKAAGDAYTAKAKVTARGKTVEWTLSARRRATRRISRPTGTSRSRRAKTLRVKALRAALLASVALCTGACSDAPRHGGHTLAPEIVEASGMVRSPSREGVFWVHPDSMNPPVLHAVDREGRIVARARLTDAENVDWEDIAILGEELLVADIGNNLQSRTDLAILRIAEPALDAGTESQPIPVLERIEVRYPEQKSFPADRPLFDAESLFVFGGRMWIISKQRRTYRTVLYRVPEGPAGEVRELEPVQELEIGGQGHPYGGMVTAADVDAEQRYLAMLTYHALFIFDLRAAEGDQLLSHQVRRIELRGHITRQCESVAWDGADLIVTNEDGHIFRIPQAVNGQEMLFPARR